MIQTYTLIIHTHYINIYILVFLNIEEYHHMTIHELGKCASQKPWDGQDLGWRPVVPATPPVGSLISDLLGFFKKNMFKTPLG